MIHRAERKYYVIPLAVSVYANNLYEYEYEAYFAHRKSYSDQASSQRDAWLVKEDSI